MSRKIVVNETNINLKFVYFQIYLLDGRTPAIGLEGAQPEISVNGSSYYTEDIDTLQEMGSGSYRALIQDHALNTVGNRILSHFRTEATLDAYDEPIEVIHHGYLYPIDEITDTDVSLSYCTMQRAEIYFSKRLNSDAWLNATLKDKNNSLAMATRDIDCLNFQGKKLHHHQLLEFPRIYGFQIKENIKVHKHHIPEKIKFACLEIAYNHLDGVIIADEIGNMNINNSSFANVNQSYNIFTVQEHFRAGINSSLAWKYLLPFLHDPLSFRLVRAN